MNAHGKAWAELISLRGYSSTSMMIKFSSTLFLFINPVFGTDADKINIMKIKLLPIIMIAIFAVSCSTQKAWVYSPNSWTKEKSIDKSVVVKTFNDKRLNKNSNLQGLFWVPAVPFGWFKLNIPEASTTHTTSGMWLNYNPKEDYAKALVEELNAAAVFKEASFDDRITNSDYYFEGKIISTLYKSKEFSYCASFAGIYIWLIGAPACSVSNELSIEITCYKTSDNSVLFQKTYTATKYKKIGWIYSLPNDFAYPDLLKEVYQNLIQDLRNTFRDK